MQITVTSAQIHWHMLNVAMYLYNVHNFCTNLKCANKLPKNMSHSYIHTCPLWPKGFPLGDLVNEFMFPYHIPNYFCQKIINTWCTNRAKQVINSNMKHTKKIVLESPYIPKIWTRTLHTPGSATKNPTGYPIFTSCIPTRSHFLTLQDLCSCMYQVN